MATGFKPMGPDSPFWVRAWWLALRADASRCCAMCCPERVTCMPLWTHERRDCRYCDCG